MQVQFLAHSGFYIELEHTVLLFDWWKGELPPLPQKTLVVFASHHHPDHFDPRIFTLAGAAPQVQFVLGKDISLTPAHRRRWGITEEIAEHCLRMGGFRREEPLPGIVVETLPSTDEGVAFLVTAEGHTIYHGGDLNWWHWEGEPDPWNPEMEHNFKHYIEPLRGRHIDLAMVPLDPRLEAAEDWGLAWLMQLADVDKVLPMHQWEDYTPTERFVRKYPQWGQHILPIRENGQRFELP